VPDTQRIRKLNDEFRQTKVGGQWLLTLGVIQLPNPEEIVRLVQTYDQFCPDNDPYGEHDFGSLDHAGEKFFWKIDYYNLTLDAGSENPASAESTKRVMTVMKASEW
jgi:hypothetical protein